MQKKQRLGPAEAWAKIQKYCVYQERCHREVKDKLYSYGLATTDIDDIMAQLIEQDFLNEERFARAYAGGKFRQKKWGRMKILQELKIRDISAYCIKQAMKEIDDVVYYEQMKTLVYKRWDETAREKNVLMRKKKTSSYLIAKGYEPDLVWDVLKELS